MSYMCTACSELYKEYFSNCPRSSCNGANDIDRQEIIYVDDMFAPVLSMLNKKGYEIKRAYFGNPNNNMTGVPYIVFNSYVYEAFNNGYSHMFDSLPEPWHLRVDDDSIRITCDTYESDNMMRFQKMLAAHYDLSDFVQQLDELTY